jgi:hypothetical protein
MTVYATFTDFLGNWFVLRYEQGAGHCESVVSCGKDSDLAGRIRDFLDHEERIWQLLDRHGEVDVPISEVPS